MNDPAIRALLYPLLSGGIYVDELPTGSTRADVVHITSDFMHGYEVKGDGDTLQRVQNQLRCYAEVYDFVTFIVTEKHLAKLLPLLPEWVGVLVASEQELRPYRPAGYNATVEKAPLAALLLLDEVKQFLMARGLPGISQLRRAEVQHLLRTTHLVPLSSLAQFVREQLIRRMPQRLLHRAERKLERQRLAPLRAKRRKKQAATHGKRRKTARRKAASVFKK
ncbi:sce7726 family protein [Hymenobacter metallicola]|uniref:Sce7726 family protein n=1 Tax=Hymenobacter metallicola TaxID=2563114 RepID=A0A4Z0QJ26_9BACT|nr:sce7726 family protein [Hymenobacter metallicola]TGE29283.1 hypothetical protein E5K02_07460 [Hymenobacter metallicola]